MTDMRGSSNFRLRRGWGRTESDRKRLCQLFGPQTYLQWAQRPQFVYSGIKENCTLWFQRGSSIFQGWLSNSIAYFL